MGITIELESEDEDNEEEEKLNRGVKKAREMLKTMSATREDVAEGLAHRVRGDEMLADEG